MASLSPPEERTVSDEPCASLSGRRRTTVARPLCHVAGGYVQQSQNVALPGSGGVPFSRVSTLCVSRAVRLENAADIAGSLAEHAPLSRLRLCLWCTSCPPPPPARVSHHLEEEEEAAAAALPESKSPQHQHRAKMSRWSHVYGESCKVTRCR